MTDATILALLGAGHVVLGAVAVLAVYRVMEFRYGLGWVLAGVLALSVPVVEAVVGDWRFDPSVQGMKIMVVVSVFGAVAGLLTAVWLFQPDLQREVTAEELIEEDAELQRISELLNDSND